MSAEFSSRNTFRKNGATGLGGSARNVITSANPSGGSSASLLQKQLSFKTPICSNQFGKPDEVEMIESSNPDNLAGRYNKVRVTQTNFKFKIFSQLVFILEQYYWLDLLCALYMAANISRCAQSGYNIGNVIGNHLAGCLSDIISNKYSTFAAAKRLLHGR